MKGFSKGNCSYFGQQISFTNHDLEQYFVVETTGVRVIHNTFDEPSIFYLTQFL